MCVCVSVHREQQNTRFTGQVRTALESVVVRSGGSARRQRTVGGIRLGFKVEVGCVGGVLGAKRLYF